MRKRYSPFMRAFIFIVPIFIVSCSEHAPQVATKDSTTHLVERIDSSAPVSEIDRDNSWKPFQAKYSFTSMTVNVYTGRLAKPDYSSISCGNEEGFQEFLEERLKGKPVNFGGKYTIVETSCGTMCSALYLIDRKTGKIFSFPDVEGHWGYQYYPNSTLLLANSSLVNDSMTGYLDQWGMMPEFYRWAGTAFKLLP